PSAHAQTGCAIPINGQIKYFSPTQAGTCLTDYDQLTGVVRGMISATGVTIAGLAGAFLLASTAAAGTDINQKFTAGDGSTGRPADPTNSRHLPRWHYGKSND